MGRKRCPAETAQGEQDGQTWPWAPFADASGRQDASAFGIAPPGLVTQAVPGVQSMPAPLGKGMLTGMPQSVAPVMPKMPQMPQLPQISGMPGMVGMPGAPLDSETLAQLRFQQAAAEYEQTKHAGIAPEIAEFAEYHGLDERATRAFDEEMKKRKDTFEADMQALWVGLEGARNPSGLLMMKLKDMRMGTFRGMSALDARVQEFAKKYRLDTQAAVKLGEVLDKRDDPDGDMQKIARHLERSNKPSSLMMMLLRDLREGKPVKEPQHAAAIGSKVHEKELDRMMKKSRSRGRARSRSRERRGSGGGGAPHRSRSRGLRGRNPSRSRGKRRSRSRDRGGH